MNNPVPPSLGCSAAPASAHGPPRSSSPHRFPPAAGGDGGRSPPTPPGREEGGGSPGGEGMGMGMGGWMPQSGATHSAKSWAGCRGTVGAGGRSPPPTPPPPQPGCSALPSHPRHACASPLPKVRDTLTWLCHPAVLPRTPPPQGETCRGAGSAPCEGSGGSGEGAGSTPSVPRRRERAITGDLHFFPCSNSLPARRSPFKDSRRLGWNEPPSPRAGGFAGAAPPKVGDPSGELLQGQREGTVIFITFILRSSPRALSVREG